MEQLEIKNQHWANRVEELFNVLISPERYLRSHSPELADGLSAAVLAATGTFVLSRKPILSMLVASIVGVGVTCASKFAREST